MDYVSIEAFKSTEEMMNRFEEVRDEGEKHAKALRKAFQSNLPLSIMIEDLKGALKIKDIKRIKEIGMNFNCIGGFDLMQDVCSSFYPAKEFYTISGYWDRIGEWQI